MKAMFLSVTTGYGHHSCAKAVIERLEAKGVECRMVDILDVSSHLLKETVNFSFLASSKYLSPVYNSAYRFGELKSASTPKISFTRAITNLIAINIKKIIKEYQPDVIVCTHVYAGQVLTELNKYIKGKLTIGIVTDFTIHPYWENTDLDHYVVAHSNLTYQFERKGMDKNKLLPIGIPISNKFAEMIDKKDARTKLKIPNKKTILVMSGSMGHGNVVRNIKKLIAMGEDFQIINVCGKNKRLYNQVAKIKSDIPIHNFGWTDQINLLMSASDCIITKPGGLTTSEALAKNLMIIIASSFPGQEERNVEFLLNNGLAMQITNTFTLQEIIYSYFGASERLETFPELCKGFGSPDSAEKLAKFIVKNVK